MSFPSKYFNSIKNTQKMKEIGHKGGSVCSAKKRYAAKIREMQKKIKRGQKISDNDVAWFMERLENADANIIELTNWVEELKNSESAQRPQYQIQLIQTAIQLHKAHFGEKVKSENLNLNVNIELEEWERRIANKFHYDNKE
jgi:tRNA nucleotidyltransferase/poly(A) polymerase